MKIVGALTLLLQAAAPAGGSAAPAPQVAQATPAKPQSKDDPNRIICKRTLKTGTLAQYEKTCLTKADWRRFSDSQRDAWGDLQGTRGSTHGG